jgi:O-antigen/teichoic acid export membrane protein
MSENRYWLKSGFFTMMHRGINFVLGFLGFMILVRIFTPAEFGIWVLFISITSIIEIGRNGFLQNGLIKFLVNQNVEEEQKIQTAALILNTALTLVLIGLIWLFANPLENILNAPGLAFLLKIYSIILPLLIFHTHNLILMQAKLDFRAYFVAGIAKSLPFFSLILIFYFYKIPLTLEELAWYQNFAFALAVPVSFFQVRHSFSLQWGWPKYWMKKIFDFGKFVFGTNLISMLTGSLDKFLLGALLSPVQVAIANTAGRVMNMIEIPVNSIASIAYPKASAAHDQNKLKEVAHIFEKTVGMMLSITLPFFIITLIFADYIILFIAGQEYLDAAPFLRVVSIMAILSPYDRQSGVILDAIGKPYLNMLMVIGTFIYGLVFTWVFINSFGLYGAAYGLVAAVFFTVIIKQFFLQRYIPVRIWKPLVHSLYFYPQLLQMLQHALKTKSGKGNN